jgi:hypothetical protein
MDEAITQNTKFDLREAKRYLPDAKKDALENFAKRQHRSRVRFTILKDFYTRNHCRMTRLHLLATCAVTLGRFAGFSKTFDAMGEHFLPLNLDNQPRTNEWQNFVKACEENLPIEVRDELWLAAHFKDLQDVRASGLYAAFEAEAEQHKNEPIWQLLQQHMDVALGVRLMDHSAISGILPYETAIAHSLTLTVKKLVTAASKLVFLYSKESARAILNIFEKTPKNLISYRRTAFDIMRYFLLSFTVSKIFRQGIRSRERGRVAGSEKWNLLEMTLGERVSEIHPLINEFYANPSRFDVMATLKLETLPAKFWSRLLTTLVGQGLYESDLEKIPTRFRIFQREDGSMHFIRELYCNGKYRIFDSDFVVENGKLYEVFKDLNAAVEMNVSPIEDRGLSIEGKNFLFYGRKMPSIGLNVEFKSRVRGDGILNIDGQLSMKPKTKFGEFLAHKILRRPKDLGSIHYVATRKTS